VGVDGVIDTSLVETPDSEEILAEMETVIQSNDEADRPKVKTIMDLVEKLFPFLKEEKKNEEEQVALNLKTIDACNARSTQRQQNVKSSVESQVTVRRGTHKSCREVEKEKEENKNGRCGELDTFLAATEQPGEKPTGRDAIVKFVEGMSGHWCPKGPEVEKLDEACKAAEKEHADHKAECDLKQRTFETGFCGWKTSLTDECYNLNSCYASAVETYTDHKAIAETLVKQWKMEWQSLKKIRCYVDVWMNNEDSKTVDAAQYEKCRTENPDTSVMDIDFGKVPQKETCDLKPVSIYPGHEEFPAKEYSFTKYASEPLTCATEDAVTIPPPVHTTPAPTTTTAAPTTTTAPPTTTTAAPTTTTAAPTTTTAAPTTTTAAPTTTTTTTQVIMLIREERGENINGQTEIVSATGKGFVIGNSYEVLSVEVLRNDLAHVSEYVKSIKLAGVEVGSCHPDGGDYDCTFFDCRKTRTFTAQSTNPSFEITVHGHSRDCDCDTNTWECSKEKTVAGRTPMRIVSRIIVSDATTTTTTQVTWPQTIMLAQVYGWDGYTNGGTQTVTAKGSGFVIGNSYKVDSVEVLRNDLGHASEYVTSIKLAGVEVGACHPDGGDYDCTFFNCRKSHTFTAQSANPNFEVSVKGHSRDCDCDTNTWECSKEKTVAGRTPMNIVARVTVSEVRQAPGYR
jgi:hypothetical protein